MPKISTQLVQFQSEDGLLLPGLLFEPASSTKKVAIYLHGNGSSSVFYSFARAQAFSKALNQRGISFFTFNNRGAHYLKKLDRRTQAGEEEVVLGAAREKIANVEQDLAGATGYLQGLGYEEFYLIGHSTGANKICVYHHLQPGNPFAKYVLLGGGDDTGLLHDWLGGREKFDQYLVQAREKIKIGKGEELIPQEILNYTISWQSLYDIGNPDGDYNVFPFNEYLHELNLSSQPLFSYYHELNKPTFVVYGEKDEYCGGSAKKALEILRQEAPDEELFDFALIEKADHGFHGQENELVELVSKWLGEES